MNWKLPLPLVFIFGTALFLFSLFLFFERGKFPLRTAKDRSMLISQNTNTYLGPNQKTPANRELVRVQVLVYNDPNPKGVEIVDASFDGIQIPLKPPDIYGFRGQASFQKGKGSYKLKWEVKRDGESWPRTVIHEETVHLDPRDLWIQIAIRGGAAEIS